jgi:hypothetical protein
VSTSRLEQISGPFGLIGFESRHDRILAILDLTAIRANIIRLVEDSLKVEHHIRIARRNRDGDLGKPLTKGKKGSIEP